MRTILLIAGLLLGAGCSPSSITHNLAADENGITMRKTGWDFSRADAAAEGHCQDYGRKAELVFFGGYTIQYRCAEPAKPEGS